MEAPVPPSAAIGRLHMSPIKPQKIKMLAPSCKPETNDRDIEKARAEKAKVAAAYIKLIYHSQECFGSCKDPRCEKTKLLVNHCIACDQGSACRRQGCIQTKALMNHAQDCRLNISRLRSRVDTCLICSQVENAQADADVECLTAVAAVVHDVSDRHISKAKEAAKYISLIYHSQTCFGKCSDPLCSRTYRLVSHCIGCQDGDTCTHPGCRQTKLLMNHVQDCKRKAVRGLDAGCLICSQLDRNKVNFDTMEATKKQNDEFEIPVHPPKRFRTLQNKIQKS
jgi:hypothetical protein